MMHWWFGPNNNWWGGLGILGMGMMVIFWALVVWLIVVLVRYFSGPQKKEEQHNRPLEILKERYARGEIDKKEFEDRKRDLIN